MNLTFDPADLRPLVQEVIAEALKHVESLGSDNRLAYPEPEAAALLGIQSHQLRDARLRGEITGTKVGGRNGYEKSELLAYLARQRQGS